MNVCFGMIQKEETDDSLNGQTKFPPRVRSMKTNNRPLTICFQELVKRGREKPDVYNARAMRLRYGRFGSAKPSVFGFEFSLTFFHFKIPK